MIWRLVVTPIHCAENCLQSSDPWIYLQVHPHTTVERSGCVLGAWASSSDDEERYPHCAQWKNPWSAEQAAFGEYIPYDFNEPEEIHKVEYSDANGFSEADEGYEGIFGRHHWSWKDLVAKILADSIMHASMDVFRDRLMRQIEDLVVHKGMEGPIELQDAPFGSLGAMNLPHGRWWKKYRTIEVAKSMTERLMGSPLVWPIK
jgi:hypothetical protein